MKLIVRRQFCFIGAGLFFALVAATNNVNRPNIVEVGRAVQRIRVSNEVQIKDSSYDALVGAVNSMSLSIQSYLQRFIKVRWFLHPNTLNETHEINGGINVTEYLFRHGIHFKKKQIVRSDLHLLWLYDFTNNKDLSDVEATVASIAKIGKDEYRPNFVVVQCLFPHPQNKFMQLISSTNTTSAHAKRVDNALVEILRAIGLSHQLMPFWKSPRTFDSKLKVGDIFLVTSPTATAILSTLTSSNIDRQKVTAKTFNRLRPFTLLGQNEEFEYSLSNTHKLVEFDFIADGRVTLLVVNLLRDTGFWDEVRLSLSEEFLPTEKSTCTSDCSFQGICVKGGCFCNHLYAGSGCEIACTEKMPLVQEGNCELYCTRGFNQNPNNVCDHGCPVGFEFQGICWPCESNCKVCVYNSITTCKECFPPYQLMQNLTCQIPPKATVPIVPT